VGPGLLAGSEQHAGRDSGPLVETRQGQAWVGSMGPSIATGRPAIAGSTRWVGEMTARATTRATTTKTDTLTNGRGRTRVAASLKRYSRNMKRGALGDPF